MSTRGSDFCPEGLHIIAQGQRSATQGFDADKNQFLPCRGCIADPLMFEHL